MKPRTIPWITKGRGGWFPLLGLLGSLLLADTSRGSDELRLLGTVGEPGKPAAEADARRAQAGKPAGREEIRPEDSAPVVDPSPMITGYGQGDYASFADWDIDFGTRFNITSGVAFDSNTLLADDRRAGQDWGGLPRVGEWVYWWNVGVSFMGGAGQDGDLLGPYYGVDMDGSIFAYSSGRGEAGRDNVEPAIRAYVGTRGGKTDVRFDAAYRIQKGNTVDFADLDREARRAESNDWNFGISLLRTLDHGSLRGALSMDRTDFGGLTHLNDVDHMTWDVAWFHDPIWADKTSFGFGLRGGHFDADQNVSQSHLDPSLRMMYEYSPKTDFYGSVGYSFRNFEGDRAIGDSGTATFELGMNWAFDEVTNVHASAYRSYHPSFVTAYEDFNVTGMTAGITRALPRDFSLQVDGAYENADYFSTVIGDKTSRNDDYWRLGTTLSHPINFTWGIPGTISAFYYWNENESSDAFGFSQYFTGLRVDLGIPLGRLSR